MWASGVKAAAGSSAPTWVDRGDVANADFVFGDLTKDDAWHDMDLSGIIGTGNKLVLIAGYVQANDAGRRLLIQTKSTDSSFNLAGCYTQEASIYRYVSYWVNPDTDSIVRYMATSGGWVVMSLTVRGWFILADAV